ncbi:hypothetical protein DPMN_080359 [Dreissena polymorpha]|uniref:CCHC-type domain-containing protein n=1 Tax=Dreissena polymorpha TaxID=45954 RepID=A0A9D3YSI8_DREPO|nr:hypothetical protein DPMN_080359 [Dreissena polymorpha]
MLKVHWLPVFFDPDVLKKVFSKIEQVIKVMEDYFEYEGVQIATGVKHVLIEVEEEKLNMIPHLLNFRCGTRALVTIYGRPPLCLRCRSIGHIGRNCPGQIPMEKELPRVEEIVNTQKEIPAVQTSAQLERQKQVQPVALNLTQPAATGVQLEERQKRQTETSEAQLAAQKAVQPEEPQKGQPAVQQTTPATKLAAQKAVRPEEQQKGNET